MCPESLGHAAPRQDFAALRPDSALVATRFVARTAMTRSAAAYSMRPAWLCRAFSLSSAA